MPREQKEKSANETHRYPRWRLWRIVMELVDLHDKYGEETDLDNTHLMTLTICPYHEENGIDIKDEIREAQKKCAHNDKPNFFKNGFCFYYRSSISGHCDRHTWEKKEEK
jgi:hypothetical protein